jgi:hypothetical protein
MANPITTENLNTGTTAWIYTNQGTTVQGYCDKTSYNPGDTVTFFVSVNGAATSYVITIFRLGWYNGLGGCLKYTSSGTTGTAQGYWDGAVLHNCPTQIFDGTTHNFEAGWASTDTWVIPGNAVTGVYLAHFTDQNTVQGGLMFVVKGNASADYVCSRPSTTDAAYNAWGGYSLYTIPTTDVKVSFNKPNDAYSGVGDGYLFEIPAIKWLERQGYNLAYISDVDIHATPGILLTHKAYLSLGHDEYWTKAKRDSVEAAIASGVSAAFLGANDCYWQCRLENDAGANPNRTVVCYKCSTVATNLAIDPQYGVNNAIVTTNWRDALIGRPENTMIGQMYSHHNVGNISTANVAWKTDPAMDTAFTAGTGLVANTSYGFDLVGYEWDRVQAGGPANLKVIATSATVDENSVADTSSTTYYRAPSGALVFATGSIAWTWALDTYRRYSPVSTPVVIPGMQVLFANIMGALKGPVYGNIGH